MLSHIMLHIILCCLINYDFTSYVFRVEVFLSVQHDIQTCYRSLLSSNKFEIFIVKSSINLNVANVS